MQKKIDFNNDFVHYYNIHYKVIFYKMKTLTSMVRYYFDNNAISQYIAYDNLYRSTTLIVRLPENVHVEGDYLSNVFEQNFIIGTVNNFMKHTNFDNNGIMQIIYVFKFKWILIG